MYAIFESGGKQHRAEPGQRLALEKLGAPVGERVTFDRVLLVRDPDSGDCRVGAPYLEGARVSASVVAHFRDRKIIVFKRKRRKGYRKKQGHRQYRTQVRVEAILPGGAPPEETAETVETAGEAPVGAASDAHPETPAEAAGGPGDAPAAGGSAAATDSGPAAGDGEAPGETPNESPGESSGESSADSGENR